MEMRGDRPGRVACHGPIQRAAEKRLISRAFGRDPSGAEQAAKTLPRKEAGIKQATEQAAENSGKEGGGV